MIQYRDPEIFFLSILQPHLSRKDTERKDVKRKKEKKGGGGGGGRFERKNKRTKEERQPHSRDNIKRKEGSQIVAVTKYTRAVYRWRSQ